MVARRPAHVAIAPILCPKGVVVELKREIVEGKEEKEGEGGRPSTQSLPSSSTSYCSSHAHSTDQKHQK
jgi:hypothetical protein